MDRRTLLAAIARGDTEGWARPGPGHLRWFVYEDALPLRRGESTAGRLEQLEAEVQRLRTQVADLQAPVVGGDGSADAETVIADLRARVVRAEEANLLLIAGHADLAAAADKYREALAQYMTPGHIGQLSESARTSRS